MLSPSRTVTRFILFSPDSTINFKERSEKLWAKTAFDVNVGQVKKSRKFKTVLFEPTWRRNCGGCAAINLERTRNLSLKVASCGYNPLNI